MVEEKILDADDILPKIEEDDDLDPFGAGDGETDNECVDGHLGIKAMNCELEKTPYKSAHDATGLLKKVQIIRRKSFHELTCWWIGASGGKVEDI
ncbi:uncharacterized protein MONOS_4579 [Monocercomonoides exilis]|uniref:uncharacterized protein n=1 Tax=Monocercomonoides exilis TaxID=2049356 RepID=UPI00355995B8|nr:hypothetical protein MONOS_4579 [Monocercomonoides exilis]|eukprot:MONOS_4579.1-p1 / transcript=MONOS_4579.1 / gene=MONOS_4579 / organism=Monocercomonoides_exilis_PA203 / gene_product=unspecified product / transcript_product=unspecified product / location=Mono_scaffold00123:35597-36222(+) / protein_length=95 / sequence_SO=supercontig / SO=protein_coding / is_pseudo=false